MDVKMLDCGRNVETDIISFLHSLQVPGQPGRFLPCLQGVRKRGRHIALGLSCFALKLHYMLGLWDTLDRPSQLAWIRFIQSYQSSGKFWHNQRLRHAFIDTPVIEYLQQRLPRHKRIMQKLFCSRHPGTVQKIVMAETKQAIATLIQVGESAERPYLGFPRTPQAVRNVMLKATDWSRPWGAGGYTSAIAMFLKTQAPEVIGTTNAQELVRTCCQVYEGLVHKETGAYFTGSIPEHGQLINGAMKVLTALEWLEAPIHYPEQLINTCLTQLPNPEGCHLVDAIYVLYRCLHYTTHRKMDIQNYCLQVSEMIRQHQNPDGGFSYSIGHSQTNYYGVPIAKGFAESDIHGTILLTWAVAMIVKILDSHVVAWRVITP